ncbi:aldehyde dehydrogenase [Ramlibacter rhizophilus]|uniref:4-(hydroxymethyl)benzenesulfonate dehydrogenase n=1 Tax=Ramlibacter rhizophilus TaxID=1781167 RepID=A0A4Z0BFT8_9BURK|nr:aldehyde dehydrogenase [Ramlibacter rhizophilus]TFY97249.1 aldehyde dehydrogenase [Ramlibacter rhizophilus]
MTDKLQTLIAGRWRDASGPAYETEYPHDGSVVARLHAATAADVDEAVQAAEKARREAPWAGLKRHERAGILHRIAGGIRARAEELAQLQRLDNGKPINETRALVASAAGTFQFFAAACETWEDQLTPARGDYLTMSVHEPLGVVGAITPWNSPIASEAQKLAPALAAGCAVVFKPAEITPRMAIELAKIAEEAGVPPGIVSVLPGKGSIVGDALVKHPLVKRIAFTGGTTVGLGIQRLAAEKLMPTSLELGGKSPTIVCADADLDHAVKGVLYGIFSSSGESCIAGSRAFVHASVYEEFKRRLLAGVAQLRVGDPASERTQMGPLVNQGHRASVERFVALGREEGGRVLAGGQRPEGAPFAKGSYYLPTVFEGLRNDARMCQEEIFGPVLALLPWEDEADLIAQANDSVFGLASGIWTGDYRRAWRIGSALQTGTVWVNTYKVFSVSTPFGGVKQSGTGREKGRLGILEYTAQKSFYWGMNEAPLPWAD